MENGGAGTLHAHIIPKRARDLYDHASELRDGGKTEDALNCFKEAVAIAPDFTHALHELANCLCDLGRQEEASEYYNRALQEIGDCLYTIARQEEAMGRYWRAIGWYEEAGRYYDPDIPSSHKSENSTIRRRNRKE